MWIQFQGTFQILMGFGIAGGRILKVAQVEIRVRAQRIERNGTLRQLDGLIEIAEVSRQVRMAGQHFAAPNRRL